MNIREIRTGFRPLVWAGSAVIAADTVLAELPTNTSARVAVLVLAVAGLGLWLYGAAVRVTAIGVLAACLTGAGLCGAAMQLLQPDGPGYLLAFSATAGIGLRLPRRLGLVLGAVVVLAATVAAAYGSQHGLSVALNLAIGGSFLFVASAFAQVSREARGAAEARLDQETATREAREQAARLAERGRLAREIHDVLAHTLSGLAVQLEGARLLAEKTDADPRLLAQIGNAQHLARDGMSSAKRAVATLRGDPLPGPDQLPALVEQARLATGAPITLTVVGEPRPVPPESGLALYRAVQEALTNTAKHAAPGAGTSIAVTWSDRQVTVEATDSGGLPATPAPTSGYGLSGLAERAALVGGHLESGPAESGWRIRLTMPLEEPQP